MKFDKKSLLLYAVTDRHWLQGRTLYEAVEQALKGGVSFLQVREKDDMRLSHDEYLKEALQLRDLCRRYQVPFVIDDDVDLALETDADGVHVGQNDMEAGNVREKLGPDKILGVSAHTVKEALLAQERGADYLGVGAVFPTDSKDDAEQVDHAVLSEICRAVDIPVIAIGGITRDNILSLSGTGIAGIAVISAIFAKKDIQAAARDLRSQTLKAVNREVNL
ncbi:hypothetical protein CXIVA_04740 [Clostridium sp. SY8519]|uniref:thiamine phosphate synthase n=1 Tax=Clostridium sp. (strain SY8519) TaxID=1042156 RepID=UPI0002171B9A|nr:thiamine phosphate synthase [Clostridium sp. SY8519]BAK46441.1 hypothetical protein CXIVA_04740 [Clostridium sp. SY8519]